MRTFIIRNSDKSVNIEIKTDILADNATIASEGFEARYTNMYFIGYDDQAKTLINLQPIVEDFQQFIQDVEAADGLDLFLSTEDGEIQLTGSVAVVLGIPQSIGLSEATLGEVTVSWTDVAQSVDGYRIYRRLTSVGGSWGTAIGTVGEGVEIYVDTTVADGIEYDYKIVAYIGADETVEENVGENYSAITTTEIVQGLLHADGDYLSYPSNKVYAGEFDIQVGIQGLADGSGSIGLVGNLTGTNDRILLSFSLNRIRANIAGGSLLSSPLLSPAMDLSGRKIQRIYRDVSNDVYFVDGDNPAQFCFNKAGNFTVNSIYLTGGFGTSGYIWYYNDGDQEFLFDEGSGNTITSTDDAVTLTIQATGDINYINNTMWTAALPPPTGFVEFVSLSVSARSTANLHMNLDTNYTTYSAGTVDRRIAEITSNGNPEGFTHAIIATGTNDTANVTKFLTVSEYGTELAGAIDALQAAGITVIVAFTSSIVTSILQADKDFDSTIGAMLSGDPLNPTPEADWDFNEDLGGTVTAVLPLYVAEGKSVCTTKGCTYIDTFQNAIDSQAAPYNAWISADGIHYSTAGYNGDGEYIADQLDLLGLSGTEKFCFLGDSLGNGRTTAVSNFYNS